MEKEFVPYEQALVLKKLGYNEPCLACYDADLKDEEIMYVFEQENVLTTTNKEFSYPEDEFCTAPTYSQAFRWFRKNHKMVGTVQITVSDGSRENWFWEISDLQGRTIDDGQELSDPYDNSYEEAELACLKKLMEIIKSK